ncbi:MAG: hypothetical protein CL853_07470 [Crocinitomicaceae bacterium]|nr:hypothetical protein [Crocinitomicaceae bacterium]
MRKYLVIAFGFIVLNSSLAQHFDFKNYTIADGLPQSTVYTIFQDTKGYIWLGTQGGTSKFNGIEFKNYSQKNKLADNHVLSICEDVQKQIWTGHKYDGISCINEDSVVAYKDDNIKGSIHALSSLDSGVIALEENGEVIHLQRKNNSIELLNKISLNSTNAATFYQLKIYKNLIYITSDQGLFVLNKNLEITKHLFKGKKIKDISWGINGKMFILFVNELIVLKDSKIIEQTPLNEEFNRVVVSKKGTIYLSNRKNGALIINGKRAQKLTIENGLLSNEINTVFFDKEQNLWIGFNGSGASQLIEAKFQAYDKLIGLQHNHITAVMMDSKNRLWVVGNKSSLDLIYFDTLEISAVKQIININKKLNLQFTGLNDIYQDHLNNVWIATNQGVYILDSNLNLSDHINVTNGLSNNNVKSISEDLDKNIWLASIVEGVTKIKRNENSGFSIKAFYKKDGLCSNRFWTVFSASNGKVYFGSDDGGISVWHNNRFSTLNEKDGLTNLRAGTITEDTNGNIWTGTIGGGIFKYDGEKFTQFNSSFGLSADNPYLILADDFGKIWTGTNSGLDVINQNTIPGEDDENVNLFKHYGINQGFSGVETNQNAKCKDNFGRLWFGTVKGIISCQSKEIKDDTTTPLVHLIGKKLFLKDEIEKNKSLFNYDENHLTFDFIGLHFSNPHQVQYSYKLENFVYDEWSPWSKQKSATYANLLPGAYTFKLKAANGDGYESKITTYSFEITAPFWNTTWFYIFISIIILLIVYSFLSYRNVKIKKDKRILTHKVAERTTELNNEKVRVTKQKEIIEQKNKNITDSINYAKNIQESVLPNIKMLTDFFCSAFIYYNPRDIVSGDFYWFKQKGDYLVIASADCTGHGIPGALLSMLGSELLNQIVLDPTINSPAKAIEMLDKGIYEAINRSGESHQKDGIDLSLCTFNSKKNTFKFSGARRPILVYDGNEIQIYNSIPFSVGEIHIMKEKPIEIEIPIKEGDRIYMFSDGYIDQFGGEKNKKFLLRRFKEKIIELKNIPMNQQKEVFNQTFNLWKGDQEQVDDVLVIGIEI